VEVQNQGAMGSRSVSKCMRGKEFDTP
jgi:hypothetical protein